MYIPNSALLLGSSFHPEDTSDVSSPCLLPIVPGSGPGSSLPILISPSLGETATILRTVCLAEAHSPVKTFTCVLTSAAIHRVNHEALGSDTLSCSFSPPPEHLCFCAVALFHVCRDKVSFWEMSLNETMCFFLKDNSLWIYFSILWGNLAFTLYNKHT